MDSTQSLQQQRQQVLAELQRLAQIRRGSINQHYVHATRKDGSRVKRGPYTTYTFKAQQKTVSRYLRDPATVQLYRQQIDGFRRFQALTKELVRLGEQLSDAALAAETPVKKTTRSASNKPPK